MKYNIFSIFALILMLLPASLKAGGDPRANAAPAAFLGNEEITVFLRVLGTDLEDAEGPLYLVSGANNSTMDQTDEAVKVDDNVWSVTFVPNDHYGTTVSSIQGKITNGSGTETNTFSLSAFDPSIIEGKMFVSYPSTAIYSENVSIVFNATMSDFDDLTDVSPIYIWAWNNPESLGDAANQGSWGSIDESAACEQIGENLWRKDFVPQTYWNTEKAMSEIGFLFRNKAGDKKTNDASIPLVGPPVNEVPKVIRTFPVKFTKGDIVSLYYDLKLETDPLVKTVTDFYLETTTNVEEENNPLPGNWIVYSSSQLATAHMTPLEDSIFMIQFIPEKYYNLNVEYDLKQLNFIFRDKGGLKKSEQYSVKVNKED